jgi:hypothetical protein
MWEQYFVFQVYFPYPAPSEILIRIYSIIWELHLKKYSILWTHDFYQYVLLADYFSFSSSST